MLEIGQARLRRIVDIDRFALPIGFLLPGADIGALGSEAAWLAPDHIDIDAGAVLLGIQSHLLQIGGLTILIDTCVGADKERPRRADWHRRQTGGYLKDLAAAGLRPEDIDIVLCTHLHADHVGWNTRLVGDRWVPTFPNARYLIGRDELAAWEAREKSEPGQHNHGAFADSVLPVVEAGQVETVDDGFELAGSLSIVALPGHSPGQIGLCLCRAKAPQAFFCGDTIHSPVQVIRPDWSSAFCSDRAQAEATRRGLLETAADSGAMLVPAHLRGPLAMRITRQGDGFRPQFVDGHDL